MWYDRTQIKGDGVMISMLHGTVVEKGPESVIVDVSGVGYEVFVPGSILLDLGAAGEMVRLRTHLDVKEDALQLYGFLTKEQLDMFRLLLSVNKVGPRTALAVLSVMDVNAVVRAIRGDDDKAFATVSGIGKKTALRIILDLKEKVDKLWGPLASETGAARPLAAEGPHGGIWELARDALLSQGFKMAEVEDRLAWARSELGEKPKIQQVLTEALRFRR